ncbi:MAG: methylthioxylose transferase [Solirubrobacteraceae bacterium]|nr:methylthioxylose transferase [Solirubrobacteraceae bacterium]
MVSAGPARAPRAAALRARLPLIGAVVAAVVVAGGLILRRALGVTLGAPYPPSLGNADLGAHPLLVVSVACFALAVWLAPRLLAVRPATFAAALLGATLVLRLALAAGRGGTGAWDKVFDESRSFEAANEYLPGLPAVRIGRHFFLDRFAELVPSFPVHVAGHPPGLLLVMDVLGLDTPARLAAFCIGVGALSAPLTYAVARQLLDERGARIAGLLMGIAPQALLFGVTSADAVYCTLGLLAAWPLCVPSRAARALGALLLAVASLFAWSLLAIGAWAAIVVLLREGWRRALELCVICGVVLLAFHGAFAAATGFDPIGTIRATAEVYRAGVASMRPYWYWLLGSPIGFLIVLGLPIYWYSLRELARGGHEAVAIYAVLAVSAVMGFTKAETERIWLFFAPFVCLAAARAIARRPALLTPVLAALAAQAVLHELLSDTVW